MFPPCHVISPHHRYLKSYVITTFLKDNPEKKTQSEQEIIEH